MNMETQRAEFEAWANGRDLTRTRAGEYVSCWVQNDWETWQAAIAATGKQRVGEEISVEEDVYCSIADMIEPYVQREVTNPGGPLPASVHDSVQLIFDHWRKTRARVGEVRGDELPPLPKMGYQARGTGMGPNDVYYTPVAYTAEQMQDYARAARQPVEFERAIPTHRRESAVELLLSLGFVWNNQRWEDRRQPAQAVPTGMVLVQIADARRLCQIGKSFGQHFDQLPVMRVSALIDKAEQP